MKCKGVAPTCKKSFQSSAVLLLAMMLWLPMHVQGADDPVVEEPSEVIYIALKPAFVVNYGGVGRLKYLKAELSVRVPSTEAEEAVRHHMPFIRNNLVLLFSRQTDESLETQTGKENLRHEALQEVRSVLEAENGSSDVLDLYFNSFVIQK